MHFESAHAIAGLITYILIFLQATVGIIQFYLPGLVGGEANAKAIVSPSRTITSQSSVADHLDISINTTESLDT